MSSSSQIRLPYLLIGFVSRLSLKIVSDVLIVMNVINDYI
jgi:hypothetical protein